MPVPPPPPPLSMSGGPGPPPPPPPPPPFSLASPEASRIKFEEPKGRNALLADIQKGARLKKATQVNDRSAPQIESSKGPVREGGAGGGGTGNIRSAAPQSLGGLFAGGFPVLRPTGQRENAGSKPALQPGGNRAAGPRFPDPFLSSTKTGRNNVNSSNPPRPAALSEAASNALRALPSPPYSSSSVPPPVNTATKQPKLTVHDCSPPPPFVDRSTKMTSQLPVYPPLPPLPLLPPVSQSDSPLRSQEAPALPPPPPRPAPPYGCPSKVTEFSSSLPQSGSRDPPPSPPPPLSTRRPLFLPPSSTAISSTVHGSNVPPALPPKSPMYPFQPSRPSIQSMPLPPTPPFSQTAAATQRRMQTKAAVSAGGMLIPPPIPPARSPAMELPSKSQPSQVTDWVPSYHLQPPFRNGDIEIKDEFESKFAFHSVEEFPPPDEYKPFPRIYPSKIARVNGRDLLRRKQMR